MAKDNKAKGHQARAKFVKNAINPTTAPPGLQPSKTDPQMRVIFLLLFLTFLAAMRSQTVKGFFKNGWNGIGTSLGNIAQGKPVAAKTATDTLDWHLLLYWGGGGIALVALSDVMPTLVTMFLVLIIVEEVLVHWKDYQGLLTPPKK